MSDNNRQTTRRRVLKGVAGVGFTSAAVTSAPGRVSARQEEDESNRKTINEEYRTSYPNGLQNAPNVREVQGKVDRPFWCLMMTANAAAERVRNQLKQKKLDERASVVVRTETSRQENIQPKVVVRHEATTTQIKSADIESRQAEFETLQTETPKESTGQIQDAGKTISRTFDVVVESAPKQTPTTTEATISDIDWKYDNEYRPVPGGCHVKPRSHDSHGTFCYHMWYPETDVRYHITGAHVLAQGGHTDPNYCDRVLQPYTKSIGSTVESLCEFGSHYDVGFVQSQSVDPDFSPHLANQDGSVTDEPVNGFKSWEWITTTGQTTDITRQGSRTGERSGPVYDSDSSNGSVWIDTDFQGGDSGGPAYVIEDGMIKLVGLMLWDDGNQHAGGHSVAELNDRYGLVP